MSRAEDLDLVNALARLSPDDRSLLALRYVAGFDSFEIGRMTGHLPRRGRVPGSDDCWTVCGGSSAMTDTRDHDVELERRIRRHVERAVRPFEAGEVALAAVQTAHPSLRRSRGEFTRRAMVLMIIVVLTVLLIGAVAGGWWRAEQLTPILAVVQADPSVSAPAELTIADALGAEWIADVDDLPEAGVAAGLQRMVIDAGGRMLHVLIGHTEVDVLGSRLDATGTDELRMTTERAGQGCHAGDVGRYRARTTLTAPR